MINIRRRKVFGGRLDMPIKCCVNGCNSNYRSDIEHATLLAVPDKEPDRSNWSLGVKTDFSKLKNPVVCLKHFDKSMILRYDTYIIDDTKQKFLKKIPILKAGAAPTILPDFPLNIQEENNLQKKEETSEHMIVSKVNEIIDENHQFGNSVEDRLTDVSCSNDIAHESYLSTTFPISSSSSSSSSSFIHNSNMTETNATFKENSSNIGLMMECNEELLTQTQLNAYHKIDSSDDNIMKSLLNASTGENISDCVVSSDNCITNKPVCVNVPANSSNMNISVNSSSSNISVSSSSMNISPNSSSMNISANSTSMNISPNSSSINIPATTSSSMDIPANSSSMNIPASSSNMNIPIKISNMPVLNKAIFITPLTPPIMPVSNSTTAICNNSPVVTSRQIATTTTLLLGTNTATNVISKMPILCLPKETLGSKQTPIMIAQPLQLVQTIPRQSTILLPKTSNITNLNNTSVNTSLTTALINNGKMIDNSCKLLVDVKTGAIVGMVNYSKSACVSSENRSVLRNKKASNLNAENTLATDDISQSPTENREEKNDAAFKYQIKEPSDPINRLAYLENHYYAFRNPSRKIGMPGETNYRFKCLKCKAIIKTNINFMNHVQHELASEREKKNISDLTECNYCFRFFETHWDMQRHIQYVHLEKNTLICKICNLDFNDIEELSSHLKAIHVPSEMPYLCYVCYYRSSFYQDIINHFHRLHNDTEKVMCQFCLQVFDIQFSGKGIGDTKEFFVHLQSHEIEHLRKQCESCCLSFFSNSEYRRHVLRDHKEFQSKKGIYPHKINKLRFSELSGRKKLNKHLSVTEESLNRPYSICCECGQFMNSMHFGKFLSCGNCDYSTYCSKAFVNHMIHKHTKVKKVLHAKRSLKPVFLENPAVCNCSFYSFCGNTIAKHLVRCRKQGCRIILKNNLTNYVAKQKSRKTKASQNSHNTDSEATSVITNVGNWTLNNIANTTAVLNNTKTSSFSNRKVGTSRVNKSGSLSQFLKSQSNLAKKVLTEVTQTANKEQGTTNKVNYGVEDTSVMSSINVKENTQFRLIPVSNSVINSNMPEYINTKGQEDYINVINNSEVTFSPVVRMPETSTSRNSFMDVGLDEESLYFEIEENTDANLWDEIEIVND